MQDLLTTPSLILVQPSGHVSAANSEDLQAQLAKAVASQDVSAILVDMSQVHSLDSAGLMVLISAMSLAQQSGQSFSLCAVPPAIRIIFEVTQLDRVFQIFDSQSAFEAAMG